MIQPHFVYHDIWRSTHVTQLIIPTCMLCDVLSTKATHRVVDPTLPTATVVLVMAFEHQVTIAIKLLSGPVKFPVNIRPIHNAAIFICIYSLTLQRIIYIETLQGTVKGRQEEVSGVIELLLNVTDYGKNVRYKIYTFGRVSFNSTLN